MCIFFYPPICSYAVYTHKNVWGFFTHQFVKLSENTHKNVYAQTLTAGYMKTGRNHMTYMINLDVLKFLIMPVYNNVTFAIH